MKIKFIKKIEDFSHSYLCLSSFLYLLFPCAIYRFFLNFSGINANGAGIVAFLDKVFRAFSFALLDTGLASIPIFLISLLLYTFLKQKSAVKANLSFFSKFILVFFPYYFVMIFVYLAFSSILHIAGILILFVYSAYFATYFALFSEVSKIQFVLQCIFVMPFINLLIAVTVILVGADITLV